MQGSVFAVHMYRKSVLSSMTNIQTDSNLSNLIQDHLYLLRLQ